MVSNVDVVTACVSGLLETQKRAQATMKALGLIAATGMAHKGDSRPNMKPIVNRADVRVCPQITSRERRQLALPVKPSDSGSSGSSSDSSSGSGSSSSGGGSGGRRLSLFRSFNKAGGNDDQWFAATQVTA